MPEFTAADRDAPMAPKPTDPAAAKISDTSSDSATTGDRPVPPAPPDVRMARGSPANDSWVQPYEQGPEQPDQPPREPWGWTRRHQVALAAMTAFFVFFLAIQAWRHPFNVGAVTRTGTPILERKININTATWASLARLPGIGPIRARKIVAYRKAHTASGRRVFRSLADLRRIKGFGPKITARLAPFLTFGHAAGAGR